MKLILVKKGNYFAIRFKIRKIKVNEKNRKFFENFRFFHSLITHKKVIQLKEEKEKVFADMSVNI